MSNGILKTQSCAFENFFEHFTTTFARLTRHDLSCAIYTIYSMRDKLYALKPVWRANSLQLAVDVLSTYDFYTYTDTINRTRQILSYKSGFAAIDKSLLQWYLAILTAFVSWTQLTEMCLKSWIFYRLRHLHLPLYSYHYTIIYNLASIW